MRVRFIAMKLEAGRTACKSVPWVAQCAIYEIEEGFYLVLKQASGGRVSLGFPAGIKTTSLQQHCILTLNASLN